MKVKICNNAELDLSRSYLHSRVEGFKQTGTVKVNGACIFDDDGTVLRLISDFLSYQSKHERISHTSAETYARNLIYFLNYIRGRLDYEDDESDEVFLTVPAYVIQEYMTFLERERGLSSKTSRNRDATIRSLIEYLCCSTEDREPLRSDNPYQNGYLSKNPKRSPIISCKFDDLVVLMESTKFERERILLQFMYDSGVRRSEIQRIMLSDIRDAANFNSSEFTTRQTVQPMYSGYAPILIQGSKGRKNHVKPRWSLISIATLRRIKKYHSSPLYKKASRKYKNPEETPAFFNADGTKYTSGAISKLLDRVSKRAIKMGYLSRSISPHKLRHGNAYAILQSNDLGVDYLDRLVVVQKSLGHSHLDTTQIYTSLPQEIYNTMCDDNGEVLTRAIKMEHLVERTQLKIGIRDSK